MPNKFAEEGSHEQRLPHGFSSHSYDADDCIWRYKDSDGRVWKSAPFCRYSELTADFEDPSWTATPVASPTTPRPRSREESCYWKDVNGRWYYGPSDRSLQGELAPVSPEVVDRLDLESLASSSDDGETKSWDPLSSDSDPLPSPGSRPVFQHRLQARPALHVQTHLAPPSEESGYTTPTPTSPGARSLRKRLTDTLRRKISSENGLLRPARSFSRMFSPRVATPNDTDTLEPRPYTPVTIVESPAPITFDEVSARWDTDLKKQG